MIRFYFFVVGFTISLIIICYLAIKLRRVSQQISIIEEALNDIKKGNWNRKLLTYDNDMTKSICYSINEFTTNSQTQLIQLKQAELAYKRLMTNLSHDVKTPLTSLVGYLEAVEEKIVSGKEKEEYITIALGKAHHLSHFVETLFEWVKLDANEQGFLEEATDIYEYTRNLLVDWIPTFEVNHFDYEINIPNHESFMPIDRQAYARIINNLLQNALSHSGGTKIEFNMIDRKECLLIEVSDNGDGISSTDLPHIFERLYQGDESRATNGNGLGLAIVKELVHLHNGTIHVKGNNVYGGTTFVIKLPKHV